MLLPTVNSVISPINVGALGFGLYTSFNARDILFQFCVN